MGLAENPVRLPEGLVQNLIGGLVVRLLGHVYHFNLYNRSKSPYFQ